MTAVLQTQRHHVRLPIAAGPRAVGWAVAPLLAALAGCQTTSGLPTVDDAQRRPINSAAAIELQSCKAEANALRATLSETLAPQCPKTEFAVKLATAAAPAAPMPGTAAAGRVAVFIFEQGQVSLSLDEQTRETLKAAAEGVELIQVRGRSGAQQETAADVLAARRRAEAAVAVLKELGVPAQKLRVSWQGTTDEGTAAGQGRRVEIEFIDKAPTVIFTRPAAEKGNTTASTGATAAPASATGTAAARSTSPKS